jgi:RNA polymerase primary sigma factor
MRQLKIGISITRRSSESLEKYIQEVSRQKLITADKEVDLAQRIRKGDATALNELVLANLRFVISVAKQYQNQGLSLEDLINEGNLGLIKAAQKFDETRGFKFISYAVWWIRQSIIQAIAEQSRMVRLPQNLVGISNKISRIKEKFKQEYQRDPSEKELADELDISVEKIPDLLRLSGHSVSVDAPFADGEEGTLLDVMPNGEADDPDSELIRESLSEEINRALSKLTDRERDIIKMSFGIGSQEYTLEEIADRFDLTRERVRQIREKVIRKLKSKRNDLLKSYCG